jgi:uncharacterized protein (DUF1684 family)
MVKIKKSFLKMQKAFLLILGFQFLLGCTQTTDNIHNKENPETEYEEYESSIKSWQENRVIGLKKNWLSLAGLFELQEGENSFGADDTNDFVFPNPKTPDYIGTFFMKDGNVTIKINPGVEVTYKDEIIEEMTLLNDQSGSPTILQLGSLTWYIIKRVDKVYVRLRDSENPDIEKLTRIDNYPLDTIWRMTAQYEPHMAPKIIETTTTSGDPSRISSSGAVGFRINGQYYRLDVWALGDSGRFQTIFADETSGLETYGAGRFIVVEKSEKTGGYIIDFNKAYNPPCAFTEFATCPIPPPQNRLPLKITAGEKIDKDLAH